VSPIKRTMDDSSTEIEGSDKGEGGEGKKEAGQGRQVNASLLPGAANRNRGCWGGWEIDEAKTNGQGGIRMGVGKPT